MGVAKLTDQNTITPDSKYALIERERRYLLQDLPQGMTRADHHLQITDNYMTGSRLRKEGSPKHSHKHERNRNSASGHPISNGAGPFGDAGHWT